MSQVVSTVDAVRSVLKLRHCPAPIKVASLRTLDAVVHSLRAHYNHSVATGAEPGSAAGKGGDVVVALQACDAVAVGQLAAKEAAPVRAAAFCVVARCPPRARATIGPAVNQNPSATCCVCPACQRFHEVHHPDAA